MFGEVNTGPMVEEKRYFMVTLIEERRLSS